MLSAQVLSVTLNLMTWIGDPTEQCPEGGTIWLHGVPKASTHPIVAWTEDNVNVNVSQYKFSFGPP